VVAVVIGLVSAGCSSDRSSPSRTAGSGRNGTSSGATGWSGTDLLWDALAGPDGFTAVGNSGVVVTSPDGKAWAQQPVSTGETLRGIASDGSTTVAVGTGGAVRSWPAGRPDTPVAHAVGSDVTLLGVAFGAGVWVVAGGGGSVFASTDLATWTHPAAVTDGDVFAVAYAAGRFVAVTDLGGIVTSADGATWSVARPEDGAWLWDVTFGNDMFVATGGGGLVLTSPDAATWSTQDAGTKQALRGVAFGRGMFVATGADATVLSSMDGRSWTAHDIGDEGVELWRPAATSSTWLAVGAGGTRRLTRPRRVVGSEHDAPGVLRGRIPRRDDARHRRRRRHRPARERRGMDDGDHGTGSP